MSGCLAIVDPSLELNMKETGMSCMKVYGLLKIMGPLSELDRDHAGFRPLASGACYDQPFVYMKGGPDTWVQSPLSR